MSEDICPDETASYSILYETGSDNDKIKRNHKL